MNTFNLSEKKIIIYGAGTQGSKVHKRLLDKGLEVLCFCDKRGREIEEFEGISVTTPEDIADFSGKDDYAVVFSVKNVYDHDAIARMLIKSGFNNQVFLPGRIITGNANDEEKAIADMYNSLVDSEEDDGKREVPPVFKVRLPKMHDVCFIGEAEGMVSARFYLPVVYTDNDVVEERKMADNNICTIYPHIQLFRRFAGDPEASVDDYMDFCIYAANRRNVKVTDAWKANVISNRLEIYNNMQRSLNFRPDYFLEHSVPAIYNENRFNICSGKHRAAFMVAKGYSCIALRVKKEDYDTYLNEPVLAEIMDYMEKNEIANLASPIEHPYFLDYPCINSEFYIELYKLAAMIMSKDQLTNTGHMDMENQSIGVGFDDGGFIKRGFARMGSSIFGLSDFVMPDFEKKTAQLLRVSYDVTPDENAPVDYAFCNFRKNADKRFSNAKNIFSFERPGSDIALPGYEKSRIGASTKNGKMIEFYLYRRG